MNRLAPLLVTLIVSTVDFAYGRFAWCWLAGPITGVALWSLRGTPKQVAVPAAARSQRAPALVD
ncbi:MAG: hypothetical protein WAU41_17380 [Gaiellaceae bacterium]